MTKTTRKTRDASDAADDAASFDNDSEQYLTPFTQTAHTLVPANPNNLMSVPPDSSKARRVIAPISAAMVARVYQPVYTWSGSSPLTAPYTPVEHGAANVLVDERGFGEYTPRTLSDKATQLGTTLADPINTPFGSIEPQEPYPVAGSPAPAAPTLASLTPNTAVVGGPAVIVVATGTGFTPYSVVEVGGTNYAPTTYISPTELRFPVDTKNSIAGAIDVKVLDHNIKTAAATFTFT